MLTIRSLGMFACLALVMIGTVAFAACGGSGSSSVHSQVKVTLKEWTLTPDRASVPAGDVIFTATNTGTVEHELVVFKTDLPADGLTLSGDAVDESAAGQTKVDEIAEFQPGTTKALTLNLQPGKYVLICNVPGHYQNGVRAAFTVTAASSTSRSY